MVTLEYFNGKEWVFVEKWNYESLCWASLGQDNFNYRTVDENGKVLNISDNFEKPFDFFSQDRV